ncbi:hypothetical protein CUMW_084650 [Citrus unshiu]|nr:hypothetical protein CUMW_084650 [Citrus unshiu]
MTMIQDYPDYADYGVNFLVDKSLITISCYNKLQMHDLLQEMGQEIVRQESVRDPSKRSRLWHHEDVYNVLKRNKGTIAIEGIFLDMSKIRDIHLACGTFTSMSNLRLLKFYMPNRDGFSIMSSKVHLDQGLEYLPEELRYLHWYGYPLRTLPSNFDPENLIALNLPYRKVEQIWKGKKYLNVDGSAISHLPSSIADLNKLEDLSFFGCKALVLPRVLSGLSSLKWMELRDCDLIKIPQDIGSLSSLEWFVLSGNNFEHLPASIKKLSRLTYLNLSGCNMLRSLPELPIRLICLDARNCERLRTLQELPSCPEELDASILESLSKHSRESTQPRIYFNFTNCLKVNGNAYNILAEIKLRLFNEKNFDTQRGISICLPGSGIPDWFSNQSSGSSITIQLPRHCCSRIFIGFAFSAVIEFQRDSDARGEYFHVRCDYTFENKHVDHCHLVQYLTIDSDHVILGFQPCCDIQPPDGDHSAAVSFRFLIENKKCHNVKCCGVNPVYANPNMTKSNTFTLKFAASSEEECTKPRIEFHDKPSRSGATGNIPGSVRRENTTTLQQQSCSSSQIFHKRGGFFSFLM